MTAQIRKESQSFNDERIKKAKDENEVWTIVKDVKTPNQIPAGLSTRMAQT